MLVLDMIYVDWIVKKEKSIGTLRCLSHALDPLGFGVWHLVRSRGVYLHTHELSRSRFVSRTWWSFQLLHKEFKEDLKPLSGVSKSQVGVLVVAVDQGKK